MLHFFCAVIRKLNEMYKNCVTYCRSLSDRLQTFLLDKQKLMDRFSGLTAEKLIYSHTVQMVSVKAGDVDIQSRLDPVCIFILTCVFVLHSGAVCCIRWDVPLWHSIGPVLS